MASPPKLQNRTLYLSRKGPWLEYQYRVCVKRKLGVCVDHELKIEKYDLTKEAVRNQLIDAGFAMKVREQP